MSHDPHDEQKAFRRLHAPRRPRRAAPPAAQTALPLSAADLWCLHFQELHASNPATDPNSFLPIRFPNPRNRLTNGTPFDLDQFQGFGAFLGALTP